MNNAFVKSPTMLTERSATAVRSPNSVQRHNPNAATAHVAPTMSISRVDHTPKRLKPCWADGFSFHNGSSKLPGSKSMAAVRQHMRAPKLKNRLTAVIPARLCALLIAPEALIMKSLPRSYGNLCARLAIVCALGCCFLICFFFALSRETRKHAVVHRWRAPVIV